MPIKMKELPKAERPYEKLEQYGEKALTNAELLAIIIKTGTKEDTAIGLAQRILKLNSNEEEDGLSFLREIAVEEFMKIKGIGKIKAIQIKALCEIAIRMNSITNYKEKIIKTPGDIAKILTEKMRFEKQEILKVAMLDNRNSLLKIKDIAIGSSNFVIATIRSILNEAVKIEASKIILVHNHPSGDSTPSKKDIELTEKVEQASEILGIKMLDHIVIGNNNYTSIFSKRLQNEREERK
ncbi:MAG: DNA repair protein RadC [Clostridia bacterium]|jgi:DNA repair protein RadC|nr:DNA repair protein RadC [Clostridia bacterium]